MGSTHDIKVAVFNDTSYDHHFGCDAVMAAISTLIRQNGGRVIYSHPFNKRWSEQPVALAAIAEADFVIVNGEGSIHHSSWRARSLASLGPYCARLSKPCFLFNATIQQNDEEITRDLSHFTRIWVRESASKSELDRAGIESTACGDLSLFHVHKTAESQKKQVLVLDSVDDHTNHKLIQIAKDFDTDLVSMQHFGKSALTYSPKSSGLILRMLRSKSRPTRPISGVKTFSDFAAYMAQHRHLITGRYHGFCFGISLGIPMSILSSNTWKSEAMLSDIGLNPRRLINGDSTPELLPLSDEEDKRMRSYVESTRGDIRRMFRTIFNG